MEWLCLSLLSGTGRKNGDWVNFPEVMQVESRAQAWSCALPSSGVEQRSFVVGVGKENKCKGLWGSVGPPAAALGAAASVLGAAMVGKGFPMAAGGERFWKPHVADGSPCLGFGAVLCLFLPLLSSLHLC